MGLENDEAKQCDEGPEGRFGDLHGVSPKLKPQHSPELKAAAALSAYMQRRSSQSRLGLFASAAPMKLRVVSTARKCLRDPWPRGGAIGLSSWRPYHFSAAMTGPRRRALTSS